MKRLLITRFSAAGDVAMCAPVVKALAEKYKDLEIVFLSRENFSPLFYFMPDNVRFWGVNLKCDYDGIKGLNKLFKEIKALKIDSYADFHDVLRTKFLRLRAFFAGIKTAKINKGRGEKKRLTRLGALKSEALKPTVERYKDVLTKLGFDVDLNIREVFPKNLPPLPAEILALTGEKTSKWVGVAPFAAHKGKILPPETMEKVVKMLSEKGAKVFLFGFGDKEKSVTEKWQNAYANVVSLVGKSGGLMNELLLISRLDCMVSMDSANMHFASLTSTRVVSVWGATHTKAGFLGFNQKEDDAVQIALPCRPCSVYGNKECRLAEKYKCLMDIQAEQIVEKVFQKI
ncbi:MAG: glycosyltransferase family 9 protein [Bacteroidales bacterium]|nr:glycosyltransferase family 9 protein [Bacteroidales bacterium]